MSYSIVRTELPTAPGVLLSESFLIDLNGDGRLDLVLGFSSMTESDTPMQFLLGNGLGGWAPSPLLVTGATPTTVSARDEVIADLNGDGKLDVFLADHGYEDGGGAKTFPGFRNTLLLSTPDGFRNATLNLPQAPDYTHSTTGADIDRDGDVDLFVGNNNYSSLGYQRDTYFLINDGQGSFSVENRAPSVADTRNGQFTASTFIDVNGDGAPDLFLGTIGTPPPRDWNLPVTPSKVLLNDGRGNFVEGGWSVPQLPFWDQVVAATPADLNGDGRQDLIISVALNNYADGGTIKLLLNTGDGFTDATASMILGSVKTLGPFIHKVHYVDVNGDGSKDIVMSGGFTSDVSPILINDGMGHFVQMPGLLPDLNMYQRLAVGDVNVDGLPDFVAQQPLDHPANTRQELRTYLSQAPQTHQDGGNGDDGLMGHGRLANTLYGASGNDSLTGGAGRDFLHGGEGDDVLFGGGEGDDVHGDQGNDTLSGGPGDDTIDGGAGADSALISGRVEDFVLLMSKAAWIISGPQELDTLRNVEVLRFDDRAVDLRLHSAEVDTYSASILRTMGPIPASVLVANGLMSAAESLEAIVKTAVSSTSVATLSYQFFTGRTPGSSGIDYLVSPTGPNPSNLNSAYYQGFNLENRYINFAMNLGREGEGKAWFASEYGPHSLSDATRKAYETIFGTRPDDAKLSALLPSERISYFQSFSGEGANGQGTKAAMVGWLLAEAAKSGLGDLAQANEDFLLDVAINGVPFGVDLVGAYAKHDTALLG